MDYPGPSNLSREAVEIRSIGLVTSWQVVLSSRTAQDQEHPSVKKLRFAVLDKSHLDK